MLRPFQMQVLPHTRYTAGSNSYEYDGGYLINGVTSCHAGSTVETELSRTNDHSSALGWYQFVKNGEVKNSVDRDARKDQNGNSESHPIRIPEYITNLAIHFYSVDYMNNNTEIEGQWKISGL
jgi:hypothetical protein